MRDGKNVRLLTDPNLGNRWMLPVNPRMLPLGRHRIFARVIFLPQSATKSRTLRVVFSSLRATRHAVALVHRLTPAQIQPRLLASSTAWARSTTPSLA